MSKKEVDRIAILSLLKERCLTQREAALRLALSVRQVRRLYKAYLISKGAQGIAAKYCSRANGGLAVSAMNGCGLCIESHTQVLIKAGISKLAIQTAVRISAVLNAFSVSLAIPQ